MANTIKPKYSNTASSVPTTANLADGEFCINTADKIIYQRVGANIIAVANYSTGGSASGTKLSALPAASAVATANEFLINEAGTSKKVTAAQIKTYLAIPALANIYYFTASGTYTKPSNLSFIIVEVQAGGGGGAGAAAVAGAFGSGAGGGGFTRSKIAAASLAASENYIVGAGGTAGANTGTNGGDGVNSSFGTTPFLTATGGDGALAIAGGTGAATAGSTAGGLGVNGNLNFPGRPSSSSIRINATVISNSSGGSSFYGAGAQALNSTGAGLNGAGYGGGASSAMATTAVASAGGTGAPGIIIVYEYLI